jgi:hypothetical protein
MQATSLKEENGDDEPELPISRLQQNDGFAPA